MIKHILWKLEKKYEKSQEKSIKIFFKYILKVEN